MVNNRVRKLRSHLRNPLLVVKKENLLYLTGRSFIAGYLLITKKDVVFFGDGLESADGLASDQIKNIGKYMQRGSALAVEHYVTVQELSYLKKHLTGIKIKTGPSPVEVLRVIKSSSELGELTEVHRITAAVFEIVKKQLRKKQWTERGLAQYIRIWGLEFGADEVSFDPIVAAGLNAAVPHHKPTEKILKSGESIIIDFGFKLNGYCSDFTRTVFLKRAPDRLAKIYTAVQQAQDLVFKQSRVGQIGQQVDATARDFLKKSGLDKYFIHSLGHGTGLEVHEAPGIGPFSKIELKNGMVFSIEPGVYVPKLGGVRIEDLVYLQKSRAKHFIPVTNKLADMIIK